jgi:hypothetical protein
VPFPDLHAFLGLLSAKTAATLLAEANRPQLAARKHFGLTKSWSSSHREVSLPFARDISATYRTA